VAIPLTSEEQMLADKAAAEAAEYARLKDELQLWTFGVSVFGVASIWLAYSRVPRNPTTPTSSPPLQYAYLYDVCNFQSLPV
jgi:hypothetical protein